MINLTHSATQHRHRKRETIKYTPVSCEIKFETVSYFHSRNPPPKFMHTTCILLFVCFVSVSAIAQNDPVPTYLTTQDFPDSVKNLKVLSLNGKSLTVGKMLEKYKGKKVVLDIWASWCRDCIVGYPKLKDLMASTSEQDLVYVFLSIDENDDKWKTTISRFSMSGEHYRLPSGWKNALSSYVALDWYLVTWCSMKRDE